MQIIEGSPKTAASPESAYEIPNFNDEEEKNEEENN